jgi:hypothetical protein
MRSHMKEKNAKRPFAIEFLEEIPAKELEKINGGKKHHKKPGPVFVTQFVSMPQPAFPNGDHG